MLKPNKFTLLKSMRRVQSEVVYDSKQISYVLHNVKCYNIIKQFIELKRRSNGDYTGKCLICNGSKSYTHFRICHKGNFFKCFNCGIFGSHIHFIQLLDKIPFDKAINKVIELSKLDIELKVIGKVKLRYFINWRDVWWQRKLFRRAEQMALVTNSEDPDLPF